MSFIYIERLGSTRSEGMSAWGNWEGFTKEEAFVGIEGCLGVGLARKEDLTLSSIRTGPC